MARTTSRTVARLLLGGLISLTTLVSPALATGPGARVDANDPLPSFWLIPERVAARTGARPPRPATTEQSSLQSALDHARTVASSYGLAFTIVRDDAVAWSGTTGVDRDGATRLALDQPFVIGSVTKTFVAAALLHLVERGALSLDDQVTKWLPTLEVARGATVRDLLAHTSGIADLYPPLKATLLGEPAHVFTHQEVIDHLGAAWFKPGAAWAYSNTNFVIAGMLLERVGGGSAEELIARDVTGPLGLRATWLLAGGRADPDLLAPSWATSFWTAGAMRSTTADLARWGAALYGAGTVVSRADLTAMTTFNKDDYGLATRRYTFGEEVAVGHSGLLGTTTSLLLYFPRQRVSLAIIANRAEVDLAGVLLAEQDGHPSLLQLALGSDAKLAAPSPVPSPSAPH
ncbi:MAG: serine hydrolase domain-containing protein [Chloroflexota bacterium]